MLVQNGAALCHLNMEIRSQVCQILGQHGTMGPILPSQKSMPVIDD